jgi:hypothetical protein
MLITTTVDLNEDETLLYTPSQAAAQIIAALGGNPSNDYCTVQVVTSGGPGSAGTPPTAVSAAE